MISILEECQELMGDIRFRIDRCKAGDLDYADGLCSDVEGLLDQAIDWEITPENERAV